MPSNVARGRTRKSPRGKPGGPTWSQARAAYRSSSQAGVLSARRREVRDHPRRLQQVRLAGCISARRSDRLSRCRLCDAPTYSTISPHRIAVGSALNGIAAACTTSSRLRARGNRSCEPRPACDNTRSTSASSRPPDERRPETPCQRAAPLGGRGCETDPGIAFAATLDAGGAAHDMVQTSIWDRRLRAGIRRVRSVVQ
jgi:hypothetical protein